MATDDTLTAWLTKRRRIHEAATEGPWRVGVEGSEGSRVNLDTGNARVDSRALFVCNGRIQPEDGNNARAIVDAHNIAVPALLAAVEEVLGKHEPIGGRVGDPSHWECGVCADDRGPKPWPCPTVTAIRDAVGVGERE